MKKLLYLNFKSKTGEWSQPKKVEIPTYNCGIVSPDEKYYFCDNTWVSSKFIEELKPKE